MMSVSLLIERVDGELVKRNVPVSTQAYFKSHWLPICEIYNLSYVPLFETGFSFTGVDIPSILGELLVIKTHLDNEDSAEEYFAKRLNLLTNHLIEVKDREVEFFIG